MTWEDIEAKPDGPPVLVPLAAGLLGCSIGYVVSTLTEMAYQAHSIRGNFEPPRTIKRRDLLWFRQRIAGSWNWQAPRRPPEAMTGTTGAGV